MINDKLELLSMAENFMIKKKSGDYEGQYEVEHKVAEVGAIINPDRSVEYYVTGVYNSGCDWAEIEMDALMDLKRFCEFMVKR